MADEQTPLLQNGPRYPHQRQRRYCTWLLTSVIVCATLLLTLSPLASKIFGKDDVDLDPDLHTVIKESWPQSSGISYEELQQILQGTPDESKARKWNHYYSSGPHLAGKNFSQAVWTRQLWQSFGVIDSRIVSYDTYINYPKGHRLAMLRGSTTVYEAKLEEDVLKEDGTSGLADRISTFHGYSASGDVTAPYVFVNYGTYQDFEELHAANIDLEGKIALIKYGGIFRGLKVKRAQELGMVGAIIYSDPGDDGPTEEQGDTPYPNGPAREPSSVQRGSTQFLSFAPGDPTTPGYPSKPGCPRQPTNETIPSIPSIPISYEDALPLLRELNGLGPKASSLGEHWEGGGLRYKNVTYHVGPSPDGLALNLVNEQEYVTTPLWNVIGVINGTIPDEVVVLGNHRDAWIAGGAADPNSGSAAFNEVIRGFGKALEQGWKPLRTIVLASWDGEEYGLIGSTEWVEEYLPWLSESAIAYINVDVGTAGPEFTAAAAPLLNDLLYDATKLVQSPNQTTQGQSVRDTWNGKIRTMGSGSDFTAFQDFAGIPCIDMGFVFNAKSPVYHYHSNYDSFDWMDRFGDPGWHYHVVIAKIWGLLTAQLVETPIIKFSAGEYAIALKNYIKALKEQIHDKGLERDGYDFGPLDEVLDELETTSDKFDKYAAALSDEISRLEHKSTKYATKKKLYQKARDVNTRYKHLERQFLYQPGLDNRKWFKHTVFAPGLWTGYSGATFPPLVESIEAGDKDNFRRWEKIITKQLHEAKHILNPH